MADSTKPIVIDKKQLLDVYKYAGVGCSLDQIAALLDLSPKTLDRIIERQPEVADAIKKGRADSGNQVMQTAYQMAVSGKIPAMTMFWLKTRMRWTEARDPGDVSDDKNAPRVIELAYKTSPKELPPSVLDAEDIEEVK